MTEAIGSDHGGRHRELHVSHMVLMRDRYRDQRLDATRQALASEHEHRVHRARELNLDLGQHIDRIT